MSRARWSGAEGQEAAAQLAIRVRHSLSSGCISRQHRQVQSPAHGSPAHLQRFLWPPGMSFVAVLRSIRSSSWSRSQSRGHNLNLGSTCCSQTHHTPAMGKHWAISSSQTQLHREACHEKIHDEPSLGACKLLSNLLSITAESDGAQVLMTCSTCYRA